MPVLPPDGCVVGGLTHRARALLVYIYTCTHDGNTCRKVVMVMVLANLIWYHMLYSYFAVAYLTLAYLLIFFSIITLFFERKFIAIAQKRLGISFLGRNG